jgi:GTP-binding protein
MGHHEKSHRGQDLIGDDSAPDAESLETGQLLFAQSCDFVLGVAGLEQLPPDALPEVAFAGRSNVGKSSLLNALTGRKALARTSNTPGRTRQLNYFNLGDRLMLVDMPGYGYAKAPKHEIAAWTDLVRDYLRGRVGLRRLCLLVDARHGLKPADRDLMALLEAAAVVFQIILTKADKAKDLEALIGETEAEITAFAAAMPRVLATSAQKGEGIAALRAELAALAAAAPLR